MVLRVIDGNNANRLLLLEPEAGGDILACTTTSGGGIGISANTLAGRAAIPYILSFPGFSPTVLASFIAGATATQSGNTVTVTATAHGIVGSAAKNGYRIYYPGSPSIPAGWYGSFAWVDANTITFTNPASQTVASESVNGGLAYTATTTVCSLTLPASSMGPNGRITLASLHAGDATAGAKFLRLVLGGTILSGISMGALPSWWSRQTVVNVGGEAKQLSPTNADGVTSGSALTTGTVNTALDQTVSVTVTLGAASLWVSMDSAELEVVKQ